MFVRKVWQHAPHPGSSNDSPVGGDLPLQRVTSPFQKSHNELPGFWNLVLMVKRQPRFPSDSLHILCVSIRTLSSYVGKIAVCQETLWEIHVTSPQKNTTWLQFQSIFNQSTVFISCLFFGEKKNATTTPLHQQVWAFGSNRSMELGGLTEPRWVRNGVTCSLNATYFGGINQCKFMVIFRDFPKIIVHEVWVGNMNDPWTPINGKWTGVIKRHLISPQKSKATNTALISVWNIFSFPFIFGRLGSPITPCVVLVATV